MHLFFNLFQVYPAFLLMYFISAAVILLASLALIVQVSLHLEVTTKLTVMCEEGKSFLRNVCTFLPVYQRTHRNRQNPDGTADEITK